MNTVYRPAFPIIGGGVDSLLIGIVEKNQNFTRKIKYFPRKRKKIRRVRKGNVFFFFFFFFFFYKDSLVFMRCPNTIKERLKVSNYDFSSLEGEIVSHLITGI